MLKSLLRSLPCLFLLLGCCITGSVVAQPIVKGPLASRIDSHLTNIVPFGFSGVIAIEKDGNLILKKAYGLRDRAANLPLTESSPFIIGSLSKQITAAAILKLEAEGKLNVTDSLHKFWPIALQSTRNLTLHQLMSHSSGLPYFSNSSLFDQSPRDKKMQELLQLTPEFTPGTKFNYSNPGYTLLAGVIEIASGMQFEKYLTSRFFEPLHMTETGFVKENDRWAKLEQPHSYSEGNDEGALSSWQEGAEFVGSGNIVSTINDLYKWEQALKSDNILPQAQRTKFFTPHIPTQGNNGYGYGWNINETIRKTKLVAHGGDLGGYNSDFRRYVDEGYTMIFISNSREGGRGWRDAAMNTSSLILNNTPLTIAPTSIAIDESGRTAITGIYSAPNAIIRVTLPEQQSQGFQVNADDVMSFKLLVGQQDEQMANQLSETTRVVLSALSTEDFEPLRANLSPSFPFEDSKMGFAQIVQDTSQGTLQLIEILGTRITSQFSARTYVKLHFERATQTVSIAWMGGKIGGAKNEPAGLSLLFVPTSTTKLVHFDPFTGKAIELTRIDGSLIVGNTALRKS